MKNSKIGWTHHTFNFVRGCTKVSEGCAFCYAETMSKRNPAVLGEWGTGAPRVYASDAYWKNLITWDKAAEKAGERHRVFSSALGDWLDEEIEARIIARLLSAIYSTPHLDHLLLTKRIQNWRERITHALQHLDPGDPSRHMAEGWLDGEAPRNIWMGVTVENQKRAEERVPNLLEIPAVVHFISNEPGLEEVDLINIRMEGECPECGDYPQMNALAGTVECGCSLLGKGDKVSWVITGGESGPKARPFDLGWARKMVADCKTYGVPVFVKQLGSVPATMRTVMGAKRGSIFMLDLKHPKGEDPAEWPTDLQVQEIPSVPR